MGCNGGDMGAAFDYLKSNKLETESDYPYKARDEACAVDADKGKAGDNG